MLARPDLAQYLIVSTLILRGRVRAKAGRHALAVRGDSVCRLVDTPLKKAWVSSIRLEIDSNHRA